MHPTSVSTLDPLAALRAAVSSRSPLAELDPGSYARDHAAFESRSDQRGLIAGWLANRLELMGQRSLSVLSVGCGDGALDAEVARRVIDGGPGIDSLRYVGVEPFAGSAARFSARMDDVGTGQVSADVVVAPFADASLDETFDVVTFVHSMYYVPNVVEALHSAGRLLKPGGSVLVLSAPRAELNRLAGLLAPPHEDHRQWFSDDVRSGIEASDLDLVDTGSIDAVVDLTDADDDVLDFTVQACLTPAFRSLVRDYLAHVSSVAGRSVVAHPVDYYVLQARERFGQGAS